MGMEYLLAVYLVMLFFQTFYVFEEVRNETYQEAGSLSTYMMASSLLLLFYYLPLLLIIFEVKWGIYVAFLPTLLAIGNGGAHLFRLINDKSLRSSLAIGITISLSLGISGILTFLGLLSSI